MASAALRVKRLSDDATMPTRGSEGAAGYDLARCESAIFPASRSGERPPASSDERRRERRRAQSAKGEGNLNFRRLTRRRDRECRSAHDCVVPARGKELVKTDLSIAIPLGTYARVAPRSGLAWKKFIDVGAGVVDYDYRGNVGVILFNHGDEDFEVKKGDRVAQLILEQILTPEVVECDDLDDTARGAGGFGSTGVAKDAAPSADASA